MKIRAGFVSNSSSSSFVMVVGKENHDKAFASLSEEDQEALKEIFSDEKWFGKEVVVSSKCGGHEGFYISGAEYDNSPFDAYKKYQKEVEKNPDEVCTHSEDW